MMADIKPDIIRLDHLKRELKTKNENTEYIDSFFDYNKILHDYKNENDKSGIVNTTQKKADPTSFF